MANTKMADEIILTPAGKKKLDEELETLKSVEMPALSERIREARALGDLSENFDYQDAKRQQGFIAGRIADLNAMLERATIVEATVGGDIVGMGDNRQPPRSRLRGRAFVHHRRSDLRRPDQRQDLDLVAGGPGIDGQESRRDRRGQDAGRRLPARSALSDLNSRYTPRYGREAIPDESPVATTAPQARA